MKAWVDPKDIALAQYTIRIFYNREKEHSSITKPLTNNKVLMIPEIRKEYEKYAKYTTQNYEALNIEIKKQGGEYAAKNFNIAYADATIFKNISLVFVAYPPQITTQKVNPYTIPPSAYINVLFIPITRTSDGRKIVTLASKILYKHFVLYRRYHIKRYLEKKPVLKAFVEKKTQQYISQGQPERRAWKNALRDLVRIIIGNIWLVGIYYLIEEGSIEPEDIILPYELAKQPELHKIYIDPIHTAEPYLLPLDMDISNITWKWLMKIKTS